MHSYISNSYQVLPLSIPTEVLVELLQQLFRLHFVPFNLCFVRESCFGHLNPKHVVLAVDGNTMPREEEQCYNLLPIVDILDDFVVESTAVRICMPDAFSSGPLVALPGVCTSSLAEGLKPACNGLCICGRVLEHRGRLVVLVSDDE